ncbi:MAG: glutamate--cysteine ligase [Herminiimonas sp.]|nr:glutamate--cysteine ligase [Herminiimonas sp.]MDB5852343.1 glutamate--cysteine ligase [Herminiimonas sp.]
MSTAHRATPDHHPAPLEAFAGIGIELEYMIVDASALNVLPMADRLLHAASTGNSNDVERGAMGWSNELVMHVIEVKNRYPSADLDALLCAFQSEVRYINRMLALYGARLMPGAMHPWMRPERETRLWPHDHAELYQAYARIFDCGTHGWANLQSMHVNLPFADDEQFARLHAAVRLLLPVLPALAASSPIADGSNSGLADFRMESYRTNAGSFDTIAGSVIPESVATRAEYERTILQPMYREIAPHDPQGLLQFEWLNSRGAIARFDRNAIEVRVIDVQECPRADLAIAAALGACAKNLFETGEDDQKLFESQRAIPTAQLAEVLGRCIKDAELAVIDNADYLGLLGIPLQRCSAGEVWEHLTQRIWRRIPPALTGPLGTILQKGPLARRILHALHGDFSHERLAEVYGALCDCLDRGVQFSGHEIGPASAPQ